MDDLLLGLLERVDETWIASPANTTPRDQIECYDDMVQARLAGPDRWVAASGGTEEPFTRNGVRYLYVWNAHTGDHAYLNLDTDIIDVDYHGSH